MIDTPEKKTKKPKQSNKQAIKQQKQKQNKTTPLPHTHTRVLNITIEISVICKYRQPNKIIS